MKKYIRYLLPCVFCGVTIMASIRFSRLIAISVANKIQRRESVRIASVAQTNECSRIKEETRSRLPIVFRLKSYGRRAKSKIESVCSTSIYGQGYLRRIDGQIMKLMTGKPRARQVIYGKDNWLFYNPDGDANPIGDYCGKIRYDETVLEDCKNGINRMASWCKNRGIDFCVIVLPNKEVMYEEYMPRSIRRYSTVTRTDLLIGYLKTNTSARIVYPKEDLFAAKSTCQVYYPTDTHWNLVGAYIGVQKLLAALGRKHCALKDENIGKRVDGHAGDLIRIGSLEGEGYPNDAEFFVEGTPILKKREVKWYEYWENINAKAPNNERLFIVGDSFRLAMLPSLSREFSRVCDDHRRNAKNFLSHVDKIKPNIIVLEFVERYSGEIGDTVKSLIGIN